MNIFTEIARLSGTEERVSLFCHRSPDPDTIGAGLGLALALESITLEVVQIVVPEAEKYSGGQFSSLEGYDRLAVSPESASTDFTVAISVDAASLEQLGNGKDLFLSSPVKVMIDHHASNMTDAEDISLFLDSDARSCATIILEQLIAAGVELTNDVLRPLWFGIVSDTVNFRYAGSREFLLAAYVNELGFDTIQATRDATVGMPASWLELLQETIPGSYIDMNKFSGHGAVIMKVNHDTVEKLGDDMVYTLQGILQRFEDPVVTIIGTEVTDESGSTIVKFSMRSKSHLKVNVADLAIANGGGGHTEAAGFTTTRDFNEVLQKLDEDFASRNN